MPTNTPAPKLSADDFKQVLTTALSDLKGIEGSAVDAIATRYGPRLAALTVSDDPQGEYDDIMTNAEIELADLGVQAETAAGNAVSAVLRTGIELALKLAVVA